MDHASSQSRTVPSVAGQQAFRSNADGENRHQCSVGSRSLAHREQEFLPRPSDLGARSVRETERLQPATVVMVELLSNHHNDHTHYCTADARSYAGGRTHAAARQKCELIPRSMDLIERL